MAVRSTWTKHLVLCVLLLLVASGVASSQSLRHAVDAVNSEHRGEERVVNSVKEPLEPQYARKLQSRGAQVASRVLTSTNNDDKGYKDDKDDKDDDDSYTLEIVLSCMVGLAVVSVVIQLVYGCSHPTEDITAQWEKYREEALDERKSTDSVS